ncbi:MAG: hypothetical protein IMF13_04510, partial [Proteobacteria bacterium]|nr:hypothetical protein [Pseudomonadota bacterium]
QGVSLQNGFSRAGDSVSVTVIADDNDEEEFLALEVDKGSGFEPVSLSADGAYLMTPLVDTLITFRAQARDPSGNSGFAEASVRAVEAEEGEPLIAGSLSGRAPVRMDAPSAPPSDPEEPSGAEPESIEGNKISFDSDIVLSYSEPLDTKTIDGTSLQVKDPEGQSIEYEIIPEATAPQAIRISPKRYLRLGACYTVHLSSSIMDLEGKNIKEENIPFKVPQPFQVARIDLKNTRDVVLAGDTLVMCNHPDGMGMTDFGEIHTYQTRDKEGRLLSEPIFLDSKQVNGRPVSLASDGGLLFVGNHYLGSLATRELLFTPYISGITDSFYQPDITLGSSPLFLPSVSGLMNPLTVGIGLTSIFEKFPFPSNLGVYDISNPKDLKKVGTSLINYLSGEPSAFVWNPNAGVFRVQVCDQGVAVLNFLDNIEIFTSNFYPQSLGVVERIHSPGQSAGRCENVFNEQVPPYNLPVPCVQDFNWPPSYVFPPNPKDCLRTSCLPTTEFLDAAFFSKKDDEDKLHYFAVVLEKDGIRVLSTDKKDLNPLVMPDRTLSFKRMTGTFVGRLGGVQDFEWWDSSGVKQQTNLVFVAGQTDNRLTIFDVNKPEAPEILSTLENSYGNMSFDPCLGLAYIHGRDGEFHVVDFNDPFHLRELNDPGPGKEPFHVEGLGSGVAFNSNANCDGVVYLGNRPGVAIVQTRICSDLASGCADRPPKAESGDTVDSGCTFQELKYPYRKACHVVDLDIDGVTDVDEERIGGFVCLDGPEDDSMRGITLSVKSRVPEGQVRLEATAGSSKIKVQEGSVPMTLPAVFAPGQVPKHLLVKSQAASDSLRDVELTLTKGSNMFQDKVRFSVLSREPNLLVESIEPDVGFEVDDKDGNPDTRTFLVPVAKSGIVTVKAQLNLEICEEDLPIQMSLVGGEGDRKLVRTVDRATPSKTVFTFSYCESSAPLETTVYVYEAKLWLYSDPDWLGLLKMQGGHSWWSLSVDDHLKAFLLIVEPVLSEHIREAGWWPQEDTSLGRIIPGSYQKGSVKRCKNDWSIEYDQLIGALTYVVSLSNSSMEWDIHNNCTNQALNVANAAGIKIYTGPASATPQVLCIWLKLQ